MRHVLIAFGSILVCASSTLASVNDQIVSINDRTSNAAAMTSLKASNSSVENPLSQARSAPPTWSLDVGLAVGAYPHYPGASQSETAVAPFPYAEYHGDRIQLNRDRLVAELFQSSRVKLNISVNGALPVSAQKNALRADMEDLELMIELGPQLELTLATWNQTSLRLDLPVRANFELTTRHAPKPVGWSADPRVHLEQKFADWEWEIDVGALWGSDSYQAVFYSVEPKDVTATRGLYQAKSGLMGWRLSSTVERRFGAWTLIGYLRQMDLSRAVNRKSPLLGQNSYLAGGVALIWKFKTK